jgi:hypothetical protein
MRLLIAAAPVPSNQDPMYWTPIVNDSNHNNYNSGDVKITKMKMYVFL